METFFLMSIFIITLVLGLVVGWIGCINYMNYLDRERHDFEDLFKKNPHPEIYEDDGSIYRGAYMNVNFEPGYDPEEFDPEDVHMDE
jgi:hypothetical protein